MAWTPEQMRGLFDFLRWGDVQMLDATESLSEEEYYKERGVSIGSIHKVLVHSMTVQWLWLTRWKGTSPARIEDHTDYPTRAALVDRWPVVHLALSQFLDQQTAASLAQELTYQRMAGPVMTGMLADFMFHLVDHGTYHRGQLNAMIKQAGGKPVGVGYWNFVEARDAKRPTPLPARGEAG
jgi:uncharacterized damage-inducible protein DinB